MHDYTLSNFLSLQNPLIKNKVRQRLQHPVLKTLNNDRFTKLHSLIKENGVDVLLKECLPSYTRLTTFHKFVDYDKVKLNTSFVTNDLQSFGPSHENLQRCCISKERIEYIKGIYRKANLAHKRNNQITANLELLLHNKKMNENYDVRHLFMNNKLPQFFLKDSSFSSNIHIPHRKFNINQFQGYMSDLELECVHERQSLPKIYVKELDALPSIFYEYQPLTNIDSKKPITFTESVESKSSFTNLQHQSLKFDAHFKKFQTNKFQGYVAQ